MYQRLGVQLVEGKGPQGFGNLCQPPPPAQASLLIFWAQTPRSLVWPHKRKHYFEQSTNRQAATEQAQRPQQRGKKKSTSRLEKRGSKTHVCEPWPSVRGLGPFPPL